MDGLLGAIESKAGELAKIVSTSAPLIGYAIGGPIAPIATVALEMLAKKFGADPKKVEDVVQKITAAPDAEVKLREANLEFEKIHSQNYQTAINDTQSARGMIMDIFDRESNRLWGISINIYYIMPVLITAFIMTCWLMVLFNAVNAPGDKMVLISDKMDAQVWIVLGYWFGKSILQKLQR